jgi:hypothetical protein
MRVVAELVLWWLALTSAYLMLVTSPTGAEVPVGLGVAAVAAAAAVAGRRAFRPPGPVPRFARRGVLVPVDVVVDAPILTGLLITGRAFRRDCGRTDEIELPDDDATSAWAVLLTTASPGSLAQDVEKRGDGLVLRRHRMTSHHRATAELEAR